jgi:hypothetical protein
VRNYLLKFKKILGMKNEKKKIKKKMFLSFNNRIEGTEFGVES